MRSLRFLLTAAVMLAATSAFAQHGGRHRTGYEWSPQFNHYYQQMPHSTYNYRPYSYHVPAYPAYRHYPSYSGSTTTFSYSYYNGRVIPTFSQSYPTYNYGGYWGW